MRMLVLTLFAPLAVLSGCNDCSRLARADVTIGTGEQDYVPLADEDPTWDLVHGPQGGWHVLIGLEAAGLDATEIVVGDMVGRLGDTVVARNDATWLTFRCDAETRTLQSWNTFLILDVEDHCPLHGQALAVEVEVQDVRGRTASDAVTATIVDPEQDTCEADDAS